MKINSKYHSNKHNREFECVVHIENKNISKITSLDGAEFMIELDELQPSIYGTKHFSLWKNIQNNGYPYYLVYNSKSGQKRLYIDYSILSYLITKLRLKVKNSYYITTFIVYSFMGLIGIFLKIINGEFILSQLDIFIFVWCILAFFIIWNLKSKTEIKDKEILSLKKKLMNMKINRLNKTKCQ